MKKVLIIEDDQIVANIYRNKLSVEGFKVEIALDGETGLVMARDFAPDAVLLDLMLPKVPGIELMRTLRAEAAFAQTPFIVFSNTYLSNMVQEAWKAGATKCLSKASCTPKHVIEAIRSSLGATGPANTAAPSAKPATPAPATADDSTFQAGLCRDLLASLPATIATLRNLHQNLVKAPDDAARTKQLLELYRLVHGLTGNAGLAGLHVISQFADAFEALLKELQEKPKNVNASTLRTVASAIDFLNILRERAALPDQQEVRAAQILVVDDEAISRRAVAHALEKARLKSISSDHPLTAFQMLNERQFDLVFLDVDMPEMNGYELCSKLRALPKYKQTPVVFVTSLNDFENRANSTMSGGNDFIAKPFLFVELAVKALIYVLRAQFTPAK